MRDFQKMIVWQKSITLAKDTYKVCRKMPDDEKFGMISQMKRASVSISSNISEGAGRTSDKEFKRFLEMALGSTYEMQNLLILSTELFPFISSECNALKDSTVSLQIKIAAFMKRL